MISPLNLIWPLTFIVPAFRSRLFFRWENERLTQTWRNHEGWDLFSTRKNFLYVVQCKSKLLILPFGDHAP